MPRKGKNFKRLVRERQAKTGESYQAAHRQVAAQKRREYEACLDAKAIHARGMSLAAVVCEIFPRPQRVVAQLREALSYMPFGEILRGLTHFQQAQESSKYLEPPGALLRFLRQIGRCVKRRTPEQSELLSLEVLEEHLQTEQHLRAGDLIAKATRSSRTDVASRATRAVRPLEDPASRTVRPYRHLRDLSRVTRPYRPLVDLATRSAELTRPLREIEELTRIRDLDEVGRVRRHIDEATGSSVLDEMNRVRRHIDEATRSSVLDELTRPLDLFR